MDTVLFILAIAGILAFWGVMLTLMWIAVAFSRAIWRSWLKNIDGG